MTCLYSLMTNCFQFSNEHMILLAVAQLTLTHRERIRGILQLNIIYVSIINFKDLSMVFFTASERSITS